MFNSPELPEKLAIILCRPFHQLPATLGCRHAWASDFRGGWVGGLAKLLEKLEKDEVPKDPRFNAAAVATWWQDNLYSGQAVIARSEPQACNWFPIRSFPQRICLHSLLGEKKKPDPLPLSYPSHRFGAGVFSFQTPRELIQALEPTGITVAESKSLDAERFYFEGGAGDAHRPERIDPDHARAAEGRLRAALPCGRAEELRPG